MARWAGIDRSTSGRSRPFAVGGAVGITRAGIKVERSLGNVRARAAKKQLAAWYKREAARGGLTNGTIFDTTRLAICNRAYSDPSHPFMRGPYHTGLSGFRPIRAHTIGAIVCSEAAPTRSRAQRRKNHNSADTTTEITMHVTIGK